MMTKERRAELEKVAEAATTIVEFMGKDVPVVGAVVALRSFAESMAFSAPENQEFLAGLLRERLTVVKDGEEDES